MVEEHIYIYIGLESMTLYAKYLKERENKEILEENQGFATYRMLDGGICYIIDIYVEESARKTGLATEMANKVCEIAKKHGCSHLIGSVCVDANKPTESLKVLLAYGMELFNVQDTMIYFKKEL